MVLGAMRDHEQVLLTQLVEAGRQGGLVHDVVHCRRNVLDHRACYRGRRADLLRPVEAQAGRERLLAGQAHQALILRTVPVVMYSAKPSGDYGALWVSENIEALTGYLSTFILG